MTTQEAKRQLWYALSTKSDKDLLTKDEEIQALLDRAEGISYE